MRACAERDGGFALNVQSFDRIIVRENREGEYSGNGGRVHRGLLEEVAAETSVFTRSGVTRLLRFAFALAKRHLRRKLTVVTKSNAQRQRLKKDAATQQAVPEPVYVGRKSGLSVAKTPVLAWL